MIMIRPTPYILLFVILISCDIHEVGPSTDFVPSSPYDDPIWHPSGKIIGFNHTPIKEIHYNNGYDHPGMATYIYEEDSSGFWLINADGTNQRRVLPYKLFTPVWSPDGNWIAFPKRGQTFKMPFDGNQFDTTRIVQLTFEVGNYLSAWSPDDRQIAYALCDDTKPCGLWIKNLESGTDELVDPYGTYPSWHPYNDSLIYIKGDSIWLYNNILKTKQLLIDITTPNYDKIGRAHV